MLKGLRKRQSLNKCACKNTIINDGVGSAIGGEVAGNKRLGQFVTQVEIIPGAEGGPVINGVGDDAGAIGHHEFS